MMLSILRQTLPRLSRYKLEYCKIARSPTQVPYYKKHNVSPIIINERYFSRKEPLCSNKLSLAYFACTIRSFTTYLSPWYILWKIGLPKNGIIKFRRGLKRFSYPWLVYCIPTAIAMGVGDIIAQNECNTQNNKCKPYDYYRTLGWALIGFGFVGPIVCKWSLYLSKVLRCNTRASYTAKKIALDQFIFAPILLTCMMAIYDMVNVKEKWTEMKALWNRRYNAPFWEILQFNIQTRPLVALFLCYICPSPLRWYIKGIYETIFSAVVSCSFDRAKLGIKEPPPPKPACRFHKDCNKKMTRIKKTECPKN